MDGLTAKDLLDKVSGGADLGLVLIGGSATFALDEITDFSPMPSGSTALVAMSLLLGVKKLVEAGLARRHREQLVGSRPSTSEQADAARRFLVGKGRFDLAEHLQRLSELHAHGFGTDAELETATKTILNKFSEEPEEDDAAAEEWHQIQRVLERAHGADRLRKYGGADGLLAKLRQGEVGIAEVRDVLRLLPE